MALKPFTQDEIACKVQELTLHQLNEAGLLLNKSAALGLFSVAIQMLTHSGCPVEEIFAYVNFIIKETKQKAFES